MAKKKAAPAQTTTEELTPEMRTLIEGGRKRGFLTNDKILNTFPYIEQNIDLVDRLYSVLAEQGIEIVEDAKEAEAKAKPEPEEEAESVLKAPEGISIDDPVRMYLKEIGKV